MELIFKIEDMVFVTARVELTPHSTIRTSYLQVKHGGGGGGGGVMV